MSTQSEALELELMMRGRMNGLYGTSYLKQLVKPSGPVAGHPHREFAIVRPT